MVPHFFKKLQTLCAKHTNEKLFMGCVGGWQMTDWQLYIFICNSYVLYQAIFDPSWRDKNIY